MSSAHPASSGPRRKPGFLPSSRSPYQLTAVMSALDEEGNVASALDDAVAAYQRLGINGEVLVFDDGSTDRTGEIVTAYTRQHPNVRLIRHERPQGIGACFWEGVHEAQGEIVVWIPGDGENLCEDIFRYLPLLDHVDIVVPFIYNREIRTPFRRHLSKIYKGIINLSFATLLNYMNGTVMYRRAVFRNIELVSKGFFYQTELLIKTIRRGYLYAEVPQALRSRRSGRSKAVTWDSFTRVGRGYADLMRSIHVTGDKNPEIAPDTVTYARRQALNEAQGCSEEPR